MPSVFLRATLRLGGRSAVADEALPASTAGSPREWRSRGHGFDPHQLHQLQQQLSGAANRRAGRFVHFLSIFREQT